MLKIRFLNDSHSVVIINKDSNLKMALDTTLDNRHMAYEFFNLDKHKPLTKGKITLGYHKISASSASVGMFNLFDPKLNNRNNHMLNTLKYFFHSKVFSSSQMNTLIRTAIKKDIQQKKAKELKKYNHIKHQYEFNERKAIYHQKKILHFQGKVKSIRPRLARAKKLIQTYNLQK